MIRIAPSLLAADFSRLAEEVDQVEKAGLKILHLDVMDGHFVPNISFGPGVIASLRPRSKMIFDVHLMIKNPENYLEDFVKAGADYLSVHVETTAHLHRTLERIRELGAKPAVALNPATSLNTIEYVLSQVEMILLMTVNPGFGGQKFIDDMLTKIEHLKTMLVEKDLQLPIEVDGGINPRTASLAAAAGAGVLVAGSAIFGQPDFKKAVLELQKAAINS